jgi:apolipoprotein N-acyltransferase
MGVANAILRFGLGCIVFRLPCQVKSHGGAPTTDREATSVCQGLTLVTPPTLLVCYKAARNFVLRLLSSIYDENHLTPRKSALARLLLAIFSGVVLTLAFPPYGLSVLAWIAFVPLFYAIEGSRPLELFGIAWLQQLVFCVTCGAWVFSTLHDFSRLSVTTSLIEFTILCSFLAAFGAAAVAISEFISRGWSVPVVLTVPLAWTASELLRTVIPISFPWNLLGYAVYREIYVIQFAEFTGVYGISALIILVNVSFYEFLFGTRTVTARRGMLLTSIAILSIALLFGAMRVAQINSAPAAGSLRVALISGGLPPAQAHTSRARAESFDLYRLNTQLTLRQHPDLVIWPECAAMFIFQPDDRYSFAMAEDAAYRRSLIELARDSEVPILFGALAFRQVQGIVTMLNRAYLLSRTGEVAGYYDKIKLVPFGEYLPMRQNLARHMTTIAGIQNLSNGDRDSLFDIAGAKLGVRICYESIFPDLTRRATAAGADILVNISNDAWYGKIGAEQALAMTAMRAVENKRPVIRVANQGFSAIISPTGGIQIPIEFSTASGAVRDVNWPAGRTFYVRFGDIFATGSLALTAAGFVLAVLMNLRAWRRQRE